MIKTYIIKIQLRNLIHDNVPKISFQMIPKKKILNRIDPVKNDSDSESNFFSLNRDRGHLQKYWAIITELTE